MTHERYFTCDLCETRFDSHDGIRNTISIENGEDSRLFSDVCDKCVKKHVKGIDEMFPKNIKAGTKFSVGAGSVADMAKEE